MAWTGEQQRTIDLRGKSILVSAAAGSGKTTVMVERVKTMITEGSASLDRMLIVTFTNAAAQEMREKIRRAVRTASRQNPGLARQLELLPRAQISTFHSFALEVIRRYFHLTGLEPGFVILDEGEAAILAQEALDELIDKHYEEGDKRFFDFLDRYSSDKSDDGARDLISEMYRTIMALPDPFGTFGEQVRLLSGTDEQFDRSPAMDFFWKLALEKIGETKDGTIRAMRLLDGAGAEKLAKKYDGVLESLDIAAAGAKAHDHAKTADGISAVSWPRLVTTKAEKDALESVKPAVKLLLDALKDSLKKLREGMFSAEPALLYSDLRATAWEAETLFVLLKEYDELFHAKKAEKNGIDFSDIEHICLGVLRDPDASAEYRDRFDHIFIDEYQDTSLVQEAIIDRIRREDNLFMVGDIKQSIYKFRLAEPEIFRDKYEDYREAMKLPGSVKEKIDLNRNFRSKPVILDTINKIFEPVMEGYDEDAMLYPGALYTGEYSFNPQLVLFDESQEADLETEETESPDGTEDPALAELKDMKKTQREAVCCAKIIRDNVGKPFEDTKNGGKIRPLEYRDIVILMRSTSHKATAWEEVMKKYEIPLYVEEDDGYFDKIEISVFMNLLAVIDNRYQDVPMISVLRSEIFGFGEDELAAIRYAYPRVSYVRAFYQYAGSRGEEKIPGLRDKCQHVISKLRRWKELSVSMPLAEFLWKLLRESGYYTAAGAMPDGLQRQANLMTLIEKAEGFAESVTGSLFSFIKYVDNLKQRDITSSQAPMISEADNVVRVMTIHKSKGLEFPMVIVCGMGNDLVYTKGEDVIYHKDIGLGMMLIDPARKTKRSTLFRDLILSLKKKEEMEENIRVLYVALTRAREKLVMTGTVKNAEKYLIEKEAGLISGKNFLTMLGYLPETHTMGISDLELPQASGIRMDPLSDNIFEFEPTEEQRKLVADRLGYRYPFPLLHDLKSKYSVSELNHDRGRLMTISASGKIKEVRWKDRPSRGAAAGKAIVSADAAQGVTGDASDAAPAAAVKEPLTAAEKGTLYHKIFEKLDFAEAAKGGIAYIKQAVDGMADAGLIAGEDVAQLDLGNIERFFGSELGKRCAEAAARGKLFREQPFTYLMPVARLTEIADIVGAQGKTAEDVPIPGTEMADPAIQYADAPPEITVNATGSEKISVQGVIDCFFEEDGELVLVDYKSNYIDTKLPFEKEAARIKDTYAVQVEIYRSALSSALGKPVKEAYLYLTSADPDLAAIRMPKL